MSERQIFNPKKKTPTDRESVDQAIGLLHDLLASADLNLHRHRIREWLENHTTRIHND